MQEKGHPTGLAVAESEQRHKLTIDSIPAMAWSATPDGMLDFLNQHFLDFVGMPADELLGLGFHRVFHPDDLPYLLSTWQEIMASGQPREVEGRLRRADRQYRWCSLRQNPLRDEGGQVVHWFGAVLDIEDRKRAENELKQARTALLASERNIRLIVDSLPVLAWVARPDGTAEFVNERWAQYAGVDAARILEWGFLDFYHPDDVPHMVEVWKQALASQDEMELKGRIRRFDGEYRWFYFAGRRITDAHGVVKWVGANVDIEDLQRAQSRLRQSENDLARVARMTTLGELAVSIAHEINQPLMAIVTNAGTCVRWLDEARFDAERARQAAQRVVRDGHRAGEIVSGIRALASKAPARMAPTDLHDAIRDVLQMLEGEFRRRRIEVKSNFPTRPLVVQGDRTQLQQVLLNLVMNSMEAMPEAESAPVLVLDVQTTGDGFARISVLDNGPGLDDTALAHLFDAFFTTKAGGMGMGLTICRSIVEAHGGVISAANQSPRGSVFSFTVPLAGE